MPYWKHAGTNGIFTFRPDWLAVIIGVDPYHLAQGAGSGLSPRNYFGRKKTQRSMARHTLVKTMIKDIHHSPRADVAPSKLSGYPQQKVVDAYHGLLDYGVM